MARLSRSRRAALPDFLPTDSRGMSLGTREEGGERETEKGYKKNITCLLKRHTHTQGQADRQTAQIGRQTETDRQTNKSQTDRQTDRDRQTGRMAERQAQLSSNTPAHPTYLDVQVRL